jgi:hypothetical protein
MQRKEEEGVRREWMEFKLRARPEEDGMNFV